MAKKPRNDSGAAQKEQNNHYSRNETASLETRNDNFRQQQSNVNDYRQRQLEDSKDYSSFKIVLFYCSLIVFLPVITFFMLKSFLLESLFTLTEIQGNIYAALGAVIALHIALALYIYRAYFNTDQLEEDKLKRN